MAIKYSVVYQYRVLGLRGAVVDIINDGTPTNYVSGGFPMPPGLAGLSRIVYATAGQDLQGRVWVFDYTTNKWRVYQYDYPATSAGPAVELPTTATIPANSTRRAIVLGY